MSALSTPGGGGTTAQSKPTSGKPKFQKLDINSLYCANKNENSEPSLVKSQLSRKHGMQSLGKVPSARRPPANLPSLKTEIGQDSNANSVSATSTPSSTPAQCSTQTTTSTTSSSVVAGTGPGGWVPLPPPSSPHFRTEFPSLEAAAQPSHRPADHSQPQLSLRPQTEGSWTSGGAGARDSASPAASPAPVNSQAAGSFRTILPPFLIKGSGGGGSGLGLGGVGSLRGGGEARAGSGGAQRQRAPPREVLTQRPILREEQISSLDDIARDAGWAQHDDIDYNQKLTWMDSDGESSSAPKISAKVNKSSNRSSAENERVEPKMDAGDEDRLWAERRQKHDKEVAAAVERARLRKQEEQRRRDGAQPDRKDKDGDRSDRERDRSHSRERGGRGGEGRGGEGRPEREPPYNKGFQQNIPPRFLRKAQAARDDKPWPYKPQPPRHNNNRRSYSRDYSDREDDFRREKENAGPQWRSEMQDYDRDRSGRDLDRQNSKDSYKEFDHKDNRRNSHERKIDNVGEIHSKTSAAEKLSEVFERKSIGLVEPFANCEPAAPAPPAAAPDPAASPAAPARASAERELPAPSPPASAGPTNAAHAPAQPSMPDTMPAMTIVKNDHPAGHQIQKQPSSEQLSQMAKSFTSHKSDKDFSESESIASKSSAEPVGPKINETPSVESLHSGVDSQKRSSVPPEDKRFSNEQSKPHVKEPVERKSSGSGSEKKGRGYSGSGVSGGTGFAVYNRGWGGREGGRGRRVPRGSRSNQRASESEGSTDGGAERRRAPAPDAPPAAPTAAPHTHEPFAPRGQPSRRGRGGFQGAARAPAPAKRLAGYGPPNTKSPFSQASRVKEDDAKDDTKINKQRSGPPSMRNRDRRPKQPGAPSGEDENWETTSEHSEGGGSRRRAPRGQGGRPQNSNRHRNPPAGKKDVINNDLIENIADLKINSKKEDEVVDDGFQEVRNKKTPKDTRGPPVKEENNQNSKARSHSNQGGGRNGSSSRPAEKPSSRGPSGKVGAGVGTGPGSAPAERGRHAALPPRFARQRQKQMDAAPQPPPPPAVNAWDKPIAPALRADAAPAAHITHPAPPPAASAADKAGVLDGTTPPVETIIFENTNYKAAPPAEALKQKYQTCAATAKPHTEEKPAELEQRLPFNGEVRPPPRSLQELIGDNGRSGGDGETLGLPMSFEPAQKGEDSSDMKLDFAFDSDLGQLEEKGSKALGMARGAHMATANNAISPLADDLNQKIASVKKVWEMPAVAEAGEELPFSGFEEAGGEAGAPPNVCKVKPTQQLQSPPPPAFAPGYGYGSLSVPSPPAVLFNSQPQQAGLYGAFLDQSRQFGGFPNSPYAAAAQTPAPYANYQPPPDIFQSLPNQYRMAAAAAAAAGGGGAAFGQSSQLANSPSTVLISSTSNSLMSASVKPSQQQQIGAIGSKGGGVGGVGGVGGGVGSYQQQYVQYGEYGMPGLLRAPAPPASSYYAPYQATPSFPLQFPPPAQSPAAFPGQLFSSQLQVAAAVQQMQQQYRAPPQMQQQYAARGPPQQLKSPLHEQQQHGNGFAMHDGSSPSPKPKMHAASHAGGHSPPQHKYSHPPPPPPNHHLHLAHHQMGMGGAGMTGVGAAGGAAGLGGASARGGGGRAPRYPAPIQRPPAPPPTHFRAPPPRHHHHNRYMHHQRNGGGGSNGVGLPAEGSAAPDAEPEPAPPAEPAPDVKPE